MSDSIIQVRGLGKSYNISHEGGKESYTALRDVLANQAKKIFSFPKTLRSEDRRNKSSIEEFWALNDVSFDIQKGDRVGIIGRNGAGKSTLLKILSRITEPSKGEIIIKGRVASLLEVGTGFHPELTGRENIFLNGAILGMSRVEIRKHFDAIVDFAEVEKFLDTPVKRYSSGMYVKLAFAVAAHLEPEILVVDEVLAVGDAQFQKKCLGKMEDVSKNEGRTVLFVSHNIGAIQKLCNKGILLQSGMIKDSGNIEKVINSYIKDTSISSTDYFFNKIDGTQQVACVTKLSIQDLEGRPVSEIPIGKAWKVVVNFTVNKSVKGLVVGLGMINALEIPIRTSWNLPQDFLPGDYKAVFIEEQITFTPGRYRLLIGLSNGNVSIQYIDKEMYIHISIATENQEDSVVQNTNGILLNQMKMYVEKN